MTHDELLEYRVSQLEDRLDRAERDRRGRPMVTATVIMSIAGLAQVATAVLAATGVLGK